MTLRILATAAAAALLAAGCGGTGGEGVPPAPDAGATVGAEPGIAGEMQTCENAPAGFAVSFPGDWETNASNGLPACSAFDPEPIVMPDDGSIPADVAIVIRREDAPHADVAQAAEGEERSFEEETLVGGYDAIVVESSDAEGRVSYRYYVDVGEGTLIAETHDVEGTDHERNRRVLDEMVETFEIY
jgi:hypothetical protein